MLFECLQSFGTWGDSCSEEGRLKGWVHHVDFDGETALLRYELCEQAYRDFCGHIQGHLGRLSLFRLKDQMET